MNKRLSIDLDKLAALFRLARECRRMTIGKASRVSGIARSTIRSIETKRRGGAFWTFAKLADAYGFRLADLVAKCTVRPCEDCKHWTTWTENQSPLGSGMYWPQEMSECEYDWVPCDGEAPPPGAGVTVDCPKWGFVEDPERGAY